MVLMSWVTIWMCLSILTVVYTKSFCLHIQKVWMNIANYECRCIHSTFPCIKKQNNKNTVCKKKKKRKKCSEMTGANFSSCHELLACWTCRKKLAQQSTALSQRCICEAEAEAEAAALTGSYMSRDRWDDIEEGKQLTLPGADFSIVFSPFFNQFVLWADALSELPSH